MAALESRYEVIVSPTFCNVEQFFGAMVTYAHAQRKLGVNTEGPAIAQSFTRAALD